MRQRGATLVEVLVAIALTGVLLPTLATALITSHAGRATARQQLKATALMQEASEAVRVVREAGWSNIATDGTYHPVISGATWALAANTETIDGFTRQVVVGTAQRDSGGALVPSGGTADPSTKRISVSVSWTKPYDGSVSEELYLSRWQDNAIWEQTSVADFTAGILSDAIITNNNGGEIELAAGTPAYQNTGTFESGTFDAGTIAAFNFVNFTAEQPANTGAQLQIATNTDNATWNFVGPDGTNTSYFSVGEAIPLDTVTGRYLRFKALLTSDGNATPLLQDVTINYSP